jgi:hypothetical protein
VAVFPSPFPHFTAAADRSVLAEGVDQSICIRLAVLLEREPKIVAEQVRAWLREDEQ